MSTDLRKLTVFHLADDRAPAPEARGLRPAALTTPNLIRMQSDVDSFLKPSS